MIVYRSICCIQDSLCYYSQWLLSSLSSHVCPFKTSIPIFHVFVSPSHVFDIWIKRTEIQSQHVVTPYRSWRNLFVIDAWWMVPFKLVSYFRKGGGRWISILDDWKILINFFTWIRFSFVELCDARFEINWKHLKIHLLLKTTWLSLILHVLVLLSESKSCVLDVHITVFPLFLRQILISAIAFHSFNFLLNLLKSYLISSTPFFYYNIYFILYYMMYPISCRGVFWIIWHIILLVYFLRVFKTNEEKYDLW